MSVLFPSIAKLYNLNNAESSFQAGFEKVIRAVVNYVRALPSIDDFDKIGNDVFGSDKDPRIRKLRESVKYYQVFDNFFKHLSLTMRLIRESLIIMTNFSVFTLFCELPQCLTKFFGLIREYGVWSQIIISIINKEYMTF